MMRTRVVFSTEKKRYSGNESQVTFKDPVSQRRKAIKRPEEVEKTDDPNYCLYHKILGHPIKNCYIFKDVL